MLPDKRAQLRAIATQLLFEHRHDKSATEADVTRLVDEGNYPDLIEFSAETVLIGPEKDAQPGTVRHLMRKILPYAPWKSNARVIIFHNAAGIKDEAETALLKTLEEPPKNHFFFLSVQSAESLKETIRSRSAIMRMTLPKESLAADPWLRFYSEMGATDFIADFPDVAAAIRRDTQSIFDEMTYSAADFQSLEQVLYVAPKKLTEKENLSVQNRALKFAILPIWAALRDIIVEGRVPPLSPVALARVDVARALALCTLIHAYHNDLEYRVYGTRPLNQYAVFYKFFAKFFSLWHSK